MFEKNKSLIASEKFFDILEHKLSKYNVDLYYKLNTYNNGKLSGHILTISDNIWNDQICIWSGMNKENCCSNYW